MIENMTIKQLLNTDIIEEVDEAIYKLIKYMNELNTIEGRKYKLAVLDKIHENITSLDDEEIGIEYDDLESPTWHPRRIVDLKGKISEIKRADNVIYKKNGDDN